MPDDISMSSETETEKVSIRFSNMEGICDLGEVSFGGGGKVAGRTVCRLCRTAR